MPFFQNLGNFHFHGQTEYIWISEPVAEFKEFERRFKFKPRFKYDWFHLKLYQMFQDLSRRLILTGFWRIHTAAQIL